MRAIRRLTLAALATVAATLAVPAAAAQGANHAVCSFSGTVYLATGAVLLGGSGEYRFRSDPVTTRCSFNTDPPAPAEIASEGNFAATACGTGTLWSGYGDQMGTPDFTTINRAGGSMEVTDASWTISLEGFQGRLDIHTVNGQTDHLPVNGVVSLVPSQGGCTDPGGVTALTVTGYFAALWGPLP
jgi:hypothetical protein